MKRPVKLVLIALLFAGAGVLTEQLADTAITRTFLGNAPAVLPFAILAALLCVRPPWLMPLVAVLHCAVWSGAVQIAVSLDGPAPKLNMCVAGLAGGLGVALATAIGCRKLFRVRPLVLLAATGAVAAIPFQLGGPDSLMSLDFAVWQGAVGTLLYALSER
jgi:hypothetical protein